MIFWMFQICFHISTMFLSAKYFKDICCSIFVIFPHKQHSKSPKKKFDFVYVGPLIKYPSFFFHFALNLFPSWFEKRMWDWNSGESQCWSFWELPQASSGKKPSEKWFHRNHKSSTAKTPTHVLPPRGLTFPISHDWRMFGRERRALSVKFFLKQIYIYFSLD